MRRATFARHFLQEIRDSTISLRNVIFSDEATFYLDGCLHTRNVRNYQKRGTLHSGIRECMVNPAFHSKKLTVWAALLDGKVFGPYSIEKIINARLYRAILTLFLTDLRVQGFDPKRLTFQQDGASPHTSYESIQFLDRLFHRTISARPSQYVGDYIDWPSRSPDINPLDYFFWNYIKEKVYRHPPQTISQLRDKIAFEFCHVPEVTVERAAIFGFQRRLVLCDRKDGDFLF